ncbi:MAG: S-layer homology domain-containing protein [Fimbriimonas sp.]
MKRTLVLASLAFASVALAQSPPDVPESHWASKAVADLYRLGILRGYPDGLYRGTRPVSRYEMAEAINALFGKQQNQTNGLTSELQALQARVKPPQQVNVEGLADMRRRLDNLESDVRQLEALRPEMQELTKRFESLTEQLRKIREDVRIVRNKRQ